MASRTFDMSALHEKHALLEPFIGTFRATVKIWMGADEPVMSTGTMVNRLDLGGRYLHQHYVRDWTDGPDPDFEGRGYWGYNTLSERFEGFWIDTASTLMSMEHGDVDADGRVWTMTTELECPEGGAMTRTSVITLTDRDHHTMESLMRGPDGVDRKVMEIAYERAT